MPLTEKGKEIKSAMEKQYGEEKGEKVFYASANKGTIHGVHHSAPGDTMHGTSPGDPGAAIEGPVNVVAGDTGGSVMQPGEIRERSFLPQRGMAQK